MTAKRIWLLTQDGTEYLACEDEQGLFSFFGSANKYTRKTLEAGNFKFVDSKHANTVIEFVQWGYR